MHGPTPLQMLVPVLGTIALLLVPLAIVVLTLKHRRGLTEMKLKAMLDLAGRGAPVPFELLIDRPRKPGIADERTGMVLVATGIGALLFAFTLPEHPAWGIGLLPLCAGLGFLVTWKIGRAGDASGNHG